MARRASAVAASSAMRGYGNAMNRQGAATPPGTPAPSPMLTDLAAGVGIPQRVNQTGGWGDVYGYLGIPRPPQTFTDAAFGPFSPILSVPINEPDPGTGQTPARRLPYRVGWNLPVGEPGTEGLKMADFGTLRTLADLYSVARACIDYLKSEIASLEWDILPTKAAAGAMRNSKSAAIDFGKRQAEALRFLRRPDLNFSNWQGWMTAMLEEELVYDALSLVVVPTWGKGRGRGVLGSDLQNVVLVSGATIRPLYDVKGWSPRPPSVAYQQYLYGVPRSDWLNIITDQDIEDAGLTGQDLYTFRGSQLMYLPRNPRTWTPYGQSCIEKGLLPIVTGLARQGWQNDYYKEGTVPAVYISPGADMSPAQIRELQNALNGIAGDPAYHHKIIVLPPNSKVDPQRATPLADQFDEIIMLQVCMAFGVQPTQIGIIPQVSTAVSPSAAKQMSQMAGEAQARATQKPRLLFYMWLMDYILQELIGQDDMRFVFAGMQEEADEKTSTDLVTSQMSHALITIDEGREKLGLVPYGTKESTEPGFLTATGWIPLAQAAQQSTALAGMNAVAGGPQQPPAAGGGGKPSKAPTKPGPAGKPSSGGAAKKPAAGNTQGAPGTRTSRAANGIKPNNPTTPGHELRAAAAKKSADDEDDQDSERQRADARDAAVADVAAIVAERLASLMLSVASGDVPLAQAIEHGTEIMRHGYATVMQQASRAAAQQLDDVEPLPLPDLHALAASRAANQQPFLMGMAQEAAQMSQTGAAPTWLPARTELYGETLRPAWEHAYGRTAAVSDPTTKIIWHLGEAEHCPLCIARDGREYTIDTLPCWPGDGGFGQYCLGGPNCKCWLEFLVGGQRTGIGENLRREAGYFQQQRQTITARRQEARQQRDEFIAGLPNTPGSDGTSARSRAQSREELRRKLADLANRRIQQSGGYPGISVEPADIPAKLIAHLLGQYGEDASTSDIPVTELMNAVESMYAGKFTEADMTKAAFTAALSAAVVDLLNPYEIKAELEALTRHALRGRDPASWDPEHLTEQDIATVTNLIKDGLDDRDMIVVNALRLRRRIVNIDGEVLSPEDTDIVEPIPVRMGDASGGGGPMVIPHDVHGIYHDVHDLTRVGKGSDHAAIVAAGLLVHAADTGRILMLQRHLGDETKEAAGQWELPGGRRENDETPLKAAIREWEEETGLHLPDGDLTGAWASPNGRYHGYVHTIAYEDDLPILDGRDQVRNPDDPDGDSTEALAWWDPDHLNGNPAVRDELHDDLDLLHAALRKKKPVDAGNVTAAHVYTQLLRNFPPKAISWVKDCRWVGPIDVPLDQFDTQDREKWAATHQPDRVQHFADKIKDGKPVHPIVAVKEPGQHTLIIVDGHHRYGGYEEAKQKAKTYIGLVEHDGGPWDETHSAQLNQGDDRANKMATLTKAEAHYRQGSNATERCRNCSMFLPQGDDEVGHCTLVEGDIRTDALCDHFELKTADKSHDHGGDAETLREYWTHENHPGPTHFAFEEAIQWGKPGDFNRCTELLMEHGHMTEEQAHGYCNLRHHEALGYWPAQHARMDRGGAKKSD